MTKNLVGIVSLFALIVISMATIPSFRATQATELVPVYYYGLQIFPMSVSGDIMAFQATSSAQSDPLVSVRRRGPDGMYNEFTQIKENAVPFTNGEWIALPTINATLDFYHLDGDIATKNVSVPMPIPFAALSFFPGNVFAGADQRSSPKTFEIYTYTNGKWAHNGSVDIGDHMVMTLQHLSHDGKHVITYNATRIDLWEFQSNPTPTFNRIESFTYTTDYNTIGLYNGVDTIVTGVGYGHPVENVRGGYHVYTKSNGEWKLTQSATAYDLGLRGTSYLGISGAFTNEDTVVLSAYAENNTTISSPSGLCLVMSRGVDGLWNQTMQLEADPKDAVSFGFNVALNDYNELLIPGIKLNTPSNYTGYIYSTCLTSPINVTCNDISTPTDCNNLDMTTLYTINSSPACGEVNATVVSSTTTDNQVKIELNFMKTASSTSCTSTVTCLTTDPIASSDPSTSSTPVKGPLGKISGAAAIEFASATLIAVALASL